MSGEGEPVDVEVEHPHVHHRTGHRWIDLIVPVAALFVSFLSILIAWHHGQVMRELVRQNERLVQANSLPFVQLYANNGEDHITLVAANSGVGPAQVRSALILIDGKPVRSLEELIQACCGLTERRNISKANLRGAMIGAGKEFPYFSADPGSPAVAPMNRLFEERRVETRICYCSVFGECWVRSSFDTRRGVDPRPVRECPAGPDQYRS